MRGNNSKIIKKANRYLILNTIRSYEPITIEEIEQKTHLSHPTVLNLVKDLLEENVIQKSGYRESSGGRQPGLLCLNAQSYYAIGVDMEFPSVRMVVSDLKGRIVHSNVWEYNSKVSYTEVMDLLLKNLEHCLTSSGIPFEKIIGIGIGLPGIIDINRDISLNIERIKGWENVHIKEIIEDKFNIPVYIRNDVHLAGLVEKNLFTDHNINNFAYIGIREGIGMAVFINGALYEGNKGNAGFLGHMTVDINGPICKCGCGTKGCVETFSSKKAIIDNYLKLKLENGKSDEEECTTTIGDILKEAANGSSIALEALKIAASKLGIGISNVVKLLDISHIIIGGFPNINVDIFTEFVGDAVKENMPYFISNDITVVSGKLEDEVFALGGCFFVIDQFYMEPKLTLSA